MPLPKPDWVFDLPTRLINVGDQFRIYTRIKHGPVRDHVRPFANARGWKVSVKTHKDGDGYLITRKG